MHLGRSLIRGAIGFGDVRGKVLEATAPNLLQLTPLHSTSRFAVVVDGDVKLLPEASAEGMGQVDAETHGEVGKRNKGDHVDRAHSRMLALVMAQVDPFRRNGSAGHGGIDSERWLGDEGYHHAVVVSVGLDVDHPRARVTDCVGDGGDDVEPPPFREIRDALYKGSQTAPPATVCRTRFTPT